MTAQRATERRTSTETRERLVAAALERFGRHGFEAVGIRAIAKDAGANLAAIKYHFGGKEALYNAVAAHIAQEIERAIGPFIDEARRRMAERPPAAGEARAMLAGLLAGYVNILVANPATESWARFIVREQMAPSPAFDILYERVMGPAHEFITGLVAIATGAAPDSAPARLTAFALIGQALVFRVARAAVLRRMEWRDVGAREMQAIGAVLAAAVAGLGAEDAR